MTDGGSITGDAPDPHAAERLGRTVGLKIQAFRGLLAPHPRPRLEAS